ncbi:hypothetical protein [Pseudomonas sp.]|uniref:hypothetical protein n=1 Tax=Pseudomonas sp. TaxID=306 RepID=UPI0025810AC9|nr:hypothetical protein [Pseudomonas sp.]
MDNKRATELASQQCLQITDWLEITNIGLGQFGAYKIESTGVYFHPNESSDNHGWSDEQIEETGSSYTVDENTKSVLLVKPRAANHGQMLTDNNSRIEFPCTPRQLLDFIEGNVSGCLFGCLPETFVSAVEKTPPQPDSSSDAALGAAVRQQRVKFAHNERDGCKERQEEYQRWRAAAEAIRDEKTRQVSKRNLAELVKKRLNLPDSAETIRRYI